MSQVSEKTDDRLEKIFQLQKGLSDSEGRVSALCTAIMHEAVELQRTTNWKWWKTPTAFNESEAREELIDIWHFVVQASLELNLTPDDIVDEYKRKNEINRERQRKGY
jgi:dimeric dUTPase (all-alpha-NTP-PPase superfamily)